MMRIITGKARGTRLVTLPGESTRPTSERVKEAVFSTLQFEISGANVLDLFAGSGQMGLEALSRGAKSATMCDRSREAVGVIQANIAKTKLSEGANVICTDFQSALNSLVGKARFDLVFLDPPYALGAVPRALSMLLSGNLLTENAKIVCETAEEKDVFLDDVALKKRFSVLKQTRYGAAFVTLLQYRSEEVSV